MADGVTTQTSDLATIPDATKIATDDAGAAGHVQIVKLAVSTDGSATLLAGDADGLLVNLGTNNDVVISDGGGSITVDGTVTATVGTVTAVTTITDPVAVTDNAGSLTVDDGGGSITVDGTVAVTGTFYQATQPVSAAALPLPTGAATSALQTQPGVDIGDVTINNASGAAAVNVQDGGNSLTVDGTVAATQSGTWTVDLGATDNAVLDAIASSLAGTLTVTGGGGGVEYTEGDTDASITGSAILWEDTGDTLRTVSAAKPLPVDVVNGSAAGTEYTEGDTDASITGTAFLWEDTGDTLRSVSAAKPLPIGDAGGSLTVDGTVSVSGTVAVTDNAGSLTVDNGGTFAVQAAQSGTWNVTDISGTVSLPTGAATSANQSTIIGHVDGIEGLLTTIDADTSALAGAVSGTEVQVDVLTMPTVTVADGGGSLTVDGTFWQATQPVSGTVTADAGSGTFTISGAVTNTVLSVVGSGTEATAQRVTIASDSTGVLSVDDNGSTLSVDDGGGSITVDGTFWQATQPVSVASVPSHDVTNAGTFATQAAQSGTWTVQPGNTANTTAWKVDASSVAVPVTDNSGSLTVDNAGTFAVQATIAAGATAIAKAEDVASADADVGVPAMAVRKATPANTSGTDGDYEFLQISGGRLWTSTTIDAALPAGTAAIGKLAANSGVDIGDVDVTSVVPGTAATSLGKAEDAGHNSGDTGVMALAVRKDTPAALAGTDADYAPLEVNELGQLHVAEVGSATLANNQVAPTNSAATLVAARNGRRRLILLNIGTVTVYVGIATVTTANGFPIDPGASLTLETTALVQGITASGTGAMAYVEEY